MLSKHLREVSKRKVDKVQHLIEARRVYVLKQVHTPPAAPPCRETACIHDFKVTVTHIYYDCNVEIFIYLYSIYPRDMKNAVFGISLGSMCCYRLKVTNSGSKPESYQGTEPRISTCELSDWLIKSKRTLMGIVCLLFNTKISADSEKISEFIRYVNEVDHCLVKRNNIFLCRLSAWWRLLTCLSEICPVCQSLLKNLC